MPPTVTEDTAGRRFELAVGDAILSTASYRQDGDVVIIDHVQTDPHHRGNGHAAELMAGTLEQIRSSGRFVTPRCSYAVGYVAERPEHHDLLA